MYALQLDQQQQQKNTHIVDCCENKLENDFVNVWYNA